MDFLPEIKSEGGECLEVVEEYKLLGVKIQSDLGWGKNTSFLCSKGYSKLWILRNLKKMGTGDTSCTDNEGQNHHVVTMRFLVVF